MKSLSSLFAALLLVTAIGCAPEAPAPAPVEEGTTEAPADGHMEAPAEGAAKTPAETPAETPATTPEAGSTTK